MPPVSQLKLIPWNTGLSVVATTKRLGHFQLSFYGLPIGSFPTFKGPLISLAKTYLKCLVSFLLTFRQCPFNLPMGPRHFGTPGNKHADSLPKAEASLSTVMFRPLYLPQLSPNRKTSLFHVSLSISTLLFLQFIQGNRSYHSPYALSFLPSLSRSKPFTIVVSQSRKIFFPAAPMDTVTNNNFESLIYDYLLYFTAYVTDLLLLLLFFHLEYSRYSG